MFPVPGGQGSRAICSANLLFRAVRFSRSRLTRSRIPFGIVTGKYVSRFLCKRRARLGVRLPGALAIPATGLAKGDASDEGEYMGHGCRWCSRAHRFPRLSIPTSLEYRHVSLPDTRKTRTNRPYDFPDYHRDAIVSYARVENSRERERKRFPSTWKTFARSRVPIVPL